MNPLIIYHRADYDGLLSRDVCFFHLCECEFKMSLKRDTIGWDYGDPVPSFEGRNLVYLVDISIPEILVPENKDKVVWIDHHKTALENFGDDWYGMRMDGVAACRLCWQWFNQIERHPTKRDFINRTVNEPELIRLAGEYDIWDKRDPAAETLQYGLRVVGWDYSMSHDYFGGLDYMLDDALVKGESAQRYADTLNKSLAFKAYRINWKGLNWCVLNASENSKSFKYAVGPFDDALMVWYWHSGKCKVILYHKEGREDLDLSQIAKEFGGGGHRGACGFMMDKIPDFILS